MNASVLDNRAHLASNIPKYFVFTTLKGLSFGLVTATWVIFLQRQHGLNLTQVTLIDVAFWIAATLGEVPTGVVADTYGRKASLITGAAIMGISLIAWTLAPTVPLIMLAYAMLAIGATFLSGAEDAFFFETLKVTKRVGDYTRLAGRVSATMLAAIAIGNLASGLLATINMRLPFLVGGASLITMFGVVLTFKEPKSEEKIAGQSRTAYLDILKQAVAIMRVRPPLRYAMVYLTLVPITAMVLETVFLQPQALALGVPLAGVGVVVMAVQFANMAGSTASHRIQGRFGETWVLYAAPLVIAVSLVLLGTFHVLPALVFAATISFTTAILRPIVMNRIQNEVSDNIRATVFSMQSLMFAFIVAFVEPLLGYAADQSGLPAAYFGLAGGLALFMTLLFWKGRQRFP